MQSELLKGGKRGGEKEIAEGRKVLVGTFSGWLKVRLRRRGLSRNKKEGVPQLLDGPRI